jgi:hypothetical protein
MRTKLMAGVAALTLALSAAVTVTPASARGWHHHHHWRGAGARIGFAAGALIGGALAAGNPYNYGPAYYGPGYYGSYAYEPPVYAGGNAIAYCEAHFKSYDPASGTYLGYDGIRHGCP